MIVIDGSLKERERLLSAIKESHKLMQNDLLEEMKKEYHKKIVVLEKEIDVLNKEHKDSLSKAGSDRQKKAKVDSAYKARIAELEDKLQTQKKHDKEQAKKTRETEKQSSRIRSLEKEIEKMRHEKKEAEQKIKKDMERHAKWRK